MPEVGVLGRFERQGSSGVRLRERLASALTVSAGPKGKCKQSGAAILGSSLRCKNWGYAPPECGPLVNDRCLV